MSGLGVARDSISDDLLAARTDLMKKAEPVIRSAVDRLEALDLDEDDIRRLMENELALRRAARPRRKQRA